MTLLIQLPQEVETALKAKALEAGEELSAFAAEILAQAVGASAGRHAQKTDSQPRHENAGHDSSRDSSNEAEDFDAALNDLFSGDSRPLPAVQGKYSREDIYFDHD